MTRVSDAVEVIVHHNSTATIFIVALIGTKKTRKTKTFSSKDTNDDY